MPLISYLFRDDQRLQATLVSDPAHITPGSSGAHVGKIQVALMDLDNAKIASGELKGKTYGPTTAQAVLAYKQARKIINFSYETAADNIVGKMTIAALDKEMAAKQEVPARGHSKVCRTHVPPPDTVRLTRLV
jgi:peptidoglycan hydrolase-like protein with peptidoglycan-binding domain